MKLFSAALTAELAKHEGFEPLVVIEVKWGGVALRYYADRDAQHAIGFLSGRIIELSPLKSRLAEDWSGAVSEMSVTLADDDLDLLLQTSGFRMEDSPVRLLLTFPEAAKGDERVLFIGVTGSPVTLKEEDRTFSFDLVSPVRSQTVGIRLDKDVVEANGLWDEAEGAILPLVCGTCRDVPAVLVKRGKFSTLKKDLLAFDDEFDVAKGEGQAQFGSGTIDLLIGDGELIDGNFSGDTFDIGTRNKTFASGVFASRQSGEDSNNPWVAWLADDVDVVGKFIIIAGTEVPGNVTGGGTTTTARRVNFVVAQRGKKVWFEKPWSRLDFSGNSHFWRIGSGVAYSAKRYAWDYVNQIEGGSANWIHRAGSSVLKWTAKSDTYVCNAIPSFEVLQVKAWRDTQDGHGAQGGKKLVIVPAKYYSVQIANASIVATYSVTTVTFPTKLSMLGKGWSDEIFVTVRSGLGSNTADQVSFLLQQYTNLFPDSSFLYVFTKLTKYPTNCAITDGRDALEAARDLAWQNRCALFIQGSFASLRYLSAQPAPGEIVCNVRDTNRVARSLILEWTERENVKTVFRAKWKRDGNDDKFREITFEKNVDVYGRQEYEREFWGFQEESLVKKSADFWSGIYSRVWRLVRLSLFLEDLRVETFDYVDVQIQPFIPNYSIARVHESNFVSDPPSIETLLWLPLESGGQIQNAEAFADDTLDVAPAAVTATPGGDEITRVTPISFSMQPERVVDGAMAKIVKQVSTGNGQYVVDVYPTGPGGIATFQAPLKKRNVSASLAVGAQLIIHGLPDGSFAVD